MTKNDYICTNTPEAYVCCCIIVPAYVFSRKTVLAIVTSTSEAVYSLNFCK